MNTFITLRDGFKELQDKQTKKSKGQDVQTPPEDTQDVSTALPLELFRQTYRDFK